MVNFARPVNIYVVSAVVVVMLFQVDEVLNAYCMVYLTAQLVFLHFKVAVVPVALAEAVAGAAQAI